MNGRPAADSGSGRAAIQFPIRKHANVSGMTCRRPLSNEDRTVEKAQFFIAFGVTDSALLIHFVLDSSSGFNQCGRFAWYQLKPEQLRIDVGIKRTTESNRHPDFTAVNHHRIFIFQYERSYVQK